MAAAAPRFVRALVPQAAALAVALTIAGCGGPTPKKADDARDRAVSTATSARMIAAAWDSGAAPGVYASHAVGEMSASLAQSERSAVWSALPVSQASAIRQELRTLAVTAARMDTAIRRNDRALVTGLRGSLLDHGTSLADLPVDTAR